MIINYHKCENKFAWYINNDYIYTVIKINNMLNQELHNEVEGMLLMISAKCKKSDSTSFYYIINGKTGIGYNAESDYYYHNSHGRNTVWNHSRKVNNHKGWYTFTKDEVLNVINKIIRK